jgi:YesN/AraC family two-component response regulator
MANPGDGFTVVTAMRYSQPNALTLLVSGYPDARSVMNAIILEAAAIIVKPLKIQVFAKLIREKMIARKPGARSAKERVGALLQRRGPRIIEHWLARVKQTKELSRLSLNDEDRTRHLRVLLEDMVVRLSKPSTTKKDSDAVSSDTAIGHGKLRFIQGYTPRNAGARVTNTSGDPVRDVAA